MASCLSALTSSKNFGSHSIHLDLVRTGLTWKADVGLCPHAVLPDLIRFRFRDMSEYLEDLAARVDAPLLRDRKFTLYHRPIFDTSNTSGFVSRAPKFKAFDEVRVAFDDWEVSVTLLRTVERLFLGITCRRSDWQLSSLVQVCNHSLHRISPLEHLYFYKTKYLRLNWQNDVENSQWLKLFHHSAL